MVVHFKTGRQVGAGVRPVAPVVAMAVALLAGCAPVGPDYVPPAGSVPHAWLGAGSADASATAPAAPGLPSAAEPAPALPADEVLAEWWRSFEDPLLTDLITRMIAANRDLRQAEARLREARARRDLAAAERWPTLDLGGSARRSKSGGSAGVGRIGNLYQAGFDAGWELDLFGGRRRGLEAADAQLEASAAELQDVLVSLAAETALNYIELRAAQARLAVAQANLALQGASADLARWRWQAGLASRLDVDQALASLEQTRAQLPSLHTELVQAGNRLAVLLGREPAALSPVAAEAGAIPAVGGQIAVGIPAEALRRRPDVRRAERELAAQTAQVGVATAARYPAFSLFGSIGLEALTPAGLLDAGARTFSLGANGLWPLFDAGRIRHGIAIETARQEQALGLYEAAVLTALQEVEDALVSYADEQSRQQALLAAGESAARALALAQDSYAGGLIDFQVVLDSQRTLLTVQDQIASSAAAVSANLVRLYKALGGGWQALPMPEAADAQAAVAAPARDATQPDDGEPQP